MKISSKTKNFLKLVIAAYLAVLVVIIGFTIFSLVKEESIPWEAFKVVSLVAFAILVTQFILVPAMTWINIKINKL